jgi:hypothetical protein
MGQSVRENTGWVAFGAKGEGLGEVAEPLASQLGRKLYAFGIFWPE